MTIDALGICLNKHLLAVRTHYITVKILYGKVIRCIYIKEHSRLLACLE